ncbi:MAG: 2-C-methyl-D-erythritol 4-phosphate cytidylyltransferase [Gammaproteobacteria bacterium]|nr:MAG: 2-C-methyl-D-erythritol 4-phosphate cytidylyltransferase [Gammaproteobacteria bacterium]
MASNLKLKHAIWAIVPAAGIGKRMRSNTPKQYLQLNGRPVLEYTINALLQNENIAGLVIALQTEDVYFSEIVIDSDKPVLRTAGGKERADSVLNALNELYRYERFDKDHDWVMVHDSVRACLRQADIDKLVEDVGIDENGGLLALPVRDTMKKQHNNRLPATVATTVERENLWHALTPQYFPAAKLRNALKQALRDDLLITDESSAMEFAGYSPMLVHGHEDNIKITRPDDLRLASLYLKSLQ